MGEHTIFRNYGIRGTHTVSQGRMRAAWIIEVGRKLIPEEMDSGVH